jgi:hypothetical protein
VQPSKSNTYFLQQAQWIDAYENMNEALKHLLSAVRTVIPVEAREETIIPRELPKVFVNAIKEEEKDDTPDLSRDEIVDVLLQKIAKFPYCLRDRTYGDLYDKFKALAKTLFDHTVSMYFKGRLTAGGVDYVYSVVLTDDTYTTPVGIAIGSASSLVLEKYGTPDEKTDTSITYSTARESLRFLIKDGSVTSVQYLKNV